MWEMNSRRYRIDIYGGEVLCGETRKDRVLVYIQYIDDVAHK